MAGRADDDVPKRATATGYQPSAEDEDERTIRQSVDPEVRSAAAQVAAGKVFPATGTAGPLRTAPVAAPGGRVMPRRPTVVGLAPPPATRADPRPQPLPGTTQAEADDGTITTAAPLTAATLTGALPLTVPSNVQIREFDEPLEETEVKTLVNDSPNKASLPTAITKINDAGITQTASPSAKASTKHGATLRSPETLALNGGGLPKLDPEDTYAGDAYTAEESVTSREAAHEIDDDQSVTAQGSVPNTPRVGDSAQPMGLQPHGRAAHLDAPRRPRKEGMDGEEAESVTKRAPGHLTNMLRVIATPDEIPEDDGTAVMSNAPMKPLGEAESGLQMAVPESVAVERASVGALIAGTPAVPPLTAPPLTAPAFVPPGNAPMNAPPVNMPPQASAPVFVAEAQHASRASFPSADGIHVPPPFNPAQVDPSGAPPKKPRYGLLVGLVAGFSFLIPLVLYLLLHRSAGDDVARRIPSEVVPDPVGRLDEKRTKAPRAPTNLVPTQRPNQGGRGKKGR